MIILLGQRISLYQMWPCFSFATPCFFSKNLSLSPKSKTAYKTQINYFVRGFKKFLRKEETVVGKYGPFMVF
jgi:hypothetical protein